MAAIEDRPALGVALLGSSPGVLAAWRDGLTARGLKVIEACRLDAFTASMAERVDGVLVVLRDVDDADLDALDAVTDRFDGPIVFCDQREADTDMLARLAGKLTAAVPPTSRVSSRPIHAATVMPTFPVWVLAASFGGPDMLRRFLGALPGMPRAAFVVAQHVGEGFAEVLAQQLNRGCALPVACAADGMPLRAGHVYIAPVRRRLAIDDTGVFRFGAAYEEQYVCMPCIDDVMTAVAGRYGPRCGAIVFSGMGDDGSVGVRIMAEAGGTIWAQDAESCAIDSMPECAAATGAVSRRGDPEGLAGALIAHLEATLPAMGAGAAHAVGDPPDGPGTQHPRP